MDDIKYWWVSQGRTWKKEYEGNFLWAPLLTDKGKKTWHHVTMQELKIGDVVFSYVKGNIVSAAKVTSLPYNADKPKSFTQWEKKGVRCDVSYNLLENPINIKEDFNSIKPLLPKNYSPLNNNGDANQIYLTQIPSSLGNYFRKARNESMVLYTKSQSGDTETIDQFVTDKKGNNERRTITVEVTRVVRDTKLSKKVKEIYNYECQICGISIITKTQSGRYAEAAHIRPLERMGDDKKENIICLCPNHHTMLDYGTISINHDYTLNGMIGELKTKHNIDKENLKYHKDHIFNDKP